MVRFIGTAVNNEAQVFLLTKIFQMTVSFINLSIGIFYIDSTDYRGLILRSFFTLLVMSFVPAWIIISSGAFLRLGLK